jgi:hypothetical protein
MTDFNDLLAQYATNTSADTYPTRQAVDSKRTLDGVYANPFSDGTTPSTVDTKKVNVAAAAEQKKTAMGKPSILPSLDQSYQTAVGGLTGQGRNTMTEYERDIRTMGPNDLRFKYGSRQAADMMSQANKANQEAILDSGASRTAGQAIRDSVVDVGSGFVMPALNIGAFGLGLVNQDAGVSAAQGLAKLNNWTQNTLQSDELNQRKKVNEARNALDSRDSKAQQEIDLSNGDGELYAGLKRLGRGAINAVSNAADDSAILGSGISSGVGSLLSGSVLAKGASTAGKGIFGALGKSGVIKSGGPINTGLAGSELGTLVDKAAFPLTVGAMEGAGVYQQTADAIAKMPFEELAKNSETFRGYVASGMTPEQARTQLANRAGITAGAITAPVAAAAGKLVAPFEANPFARASVKTVAQNGAKETLEEGIQSGWGQFSQNLLNKAVVNPNQDMYDQVGEQAGEGGLYGFGTTAAIAGPSAVKNAVSDSSKYLWGKASTAMSESVAKLEAGNEAASPLAPNKIAAEVAATQAAMPETAAAIQAGIDTSDLNQEEKTEGQAYAAKLTGALNYGEQDAAAFAGTPLVDVVAGSKDKAEAMLKLAQFVNANSEGDVGTVNFAAALELNNYVFDLEDALRSEPASLSKLPDDHPAVVRMKAIKDTLAKINAQPIVKKTLARIDAFVVAENAKAGANLTEQSMATPEGQLAAQNAANAIAHDPAKANPALVNAVLAHAASGKLVLTEKQQKGVAIAKGLFDMSREDFANRERLGLKTQDIVSNQIQSAEYLGKGQLSAVQHATEIYKAYRANDIAGARVLLEDFRKFAETIQNKMAAFNQHLLTGRGDVKKAVPYTTLGQTDRMFKDSASGVWVKPWNEASVQLMQDVAADARMIAAAYNNLKDTFSELNGQELKAVALDSRIDKPAAEVVAAFKTGVKPVSPITTNTTVDDLFDEDGRRRFPNSPAVRKFKEEHGVGADAVRLLIAAKESGTLLTIAEAKAQEKEILAARKAQLERSQSPEGRAESDAAEAAKAAEKLKEREGVVTKNQPNGISDGLYEDSETGLKFEVKNGIVFSEGAGGEMVPHGDLRKGKVDGNGVAFSARLARGEITNVSKNEGKVNTSVEPVKSLLKNIQVGVDKAKALLEKPTAEDSVKLKNVIEWANKKITAINELMAGSVSEADATALSTALEEMNALVDEATSAINSQTSMKTEPTEEELDQLQNMGFTPVDGEELTWRRGDVDVEFSPEAEDYSTAWLVYDLQDGIPVNEEGVVSPLEFAIWNEAADFIESIPVLSGIRHNMEIVGKSLSNTGSLEDIEANRKFNENYFKKTLEKLNDFIGVYESHNIYGLPNDLAPLHDLRKDIENLLDKLGEDSSVDLSTATPEQKKEVRQLLKLIRETTRAEKKAVRENPASLWNALKHSMTEWDLNQIFGPDWKKTRTFLKGKPGQKLSTYTADGRLDDFLPPNMRFGSERQVNDGYTAPNEESSAELYIANKLGQGNYLTYDTEMLLGQIGTSLQELEQALNAEDLQNALKEVEAELAKQKANREARRLAKAAATASQTTTGSDPGTSVPQAPQGSVATAKPAEVVGINIYSKSTDALGRALTNPTYDKYTLDSVPGLANVPTKFKDAERWYLANKATTGTAAEKLAADMLTMKAVIIAKLQKYPELVTQITERGGKEFLKASEHTVGVKGSRWEGVGSKSNFMKVLNAAYQDVLNGVPAVEPKKKVEPPATSTPAAVAPTAVAEPSADTGIVVPMNYRDGQDASHVMRSEFKGKSTMDLILSGDRTASTRNDLAGFKGLKKGDVFTVKNTYTGQKAQVRATTDPYLVSSVTAEEWSKLEGWAPSLYAKYKGKIAYQMQYELVNKPVTAEPSATVVSSLVQEEEADPIEEEDVSDVTPFVYTGEATGLRDEPKFSNLFGGAANRFLDAYKLPAAAISRIALVNTALETISSAVTSTENMTETMGKKPKAGYSDQLGNLYKQYVSRVGAQVVDAVKAKLAARLAYAPETGKNIGVTIQEQITASGFVNTWDTGKVFNLLNNNNGKLTYNETLLEGAVLAALQWLITSEGVTSRLTNKSVAGIFGIQEGEVPSGLATEMSIGQGELDAVTALGDKIRQYWGLEGNKDYPMDQVIGIANSMAAEILATMVGITVDTKQGPISLLSKQEFNWNTPILDAKGKQVLNKKGFPAIDRKTHNRILIDLRAVVGKHVKSLQSYPDAIEQAVLVTPEQTVYLEDERPSVARTQMRNPGAKNKKQALKAIEATQNTPYNFTHQYKLYEALGFDNMLKLFGFGSLSKEEKQNKFNKNHLKSVEGTNQGIVSGMLGMDFLRSQVDVRAEAVGKTSEEVGVHFPMQPSKVQRLQQKGRNTPQGDKLMRAVLSPHTTVINLDNKNEASYKNFLIAIAQAVGMKIERIKPDLVREQIKKQLHTELQPAVEVLQKWVNDQGAIQADATDIFIESFNNAGLELNNLALQALTEYARYLNTAKDSDERKNFTTTLYGEADGMQNGPGGAMILHSTGAFTVHELQMMRKVGYYPGKEGWTAQDQFVADDVDTYGTVANTASTLIEESKAVYDATSAPGDTQASNQVQHMLNLLELLFEGNVTFNEKGELKIKRGAAKSPVTVTIYGAGQYGIAAKIVGIITDELYSKMSDVAAAKYADRNADEATIMFGSRENFNKFTGAWEALTNFYVKTDRDSGITSLGQSDVYTPRVESVNHETAVGFTVDENAKATLTGNVKTLFVEPMDTAIRQTMGASLMSSMELIRQATQVQTLFLEDAFKTEVAKALDKKKKEDPNHQEGDFLSENELKKVLEKLKYMMPKIDTGNMEYYLAGSQSNRLENVKAFGSSLDGQFKTPAMASGPKDLGVGGIAALNIGMVDGQMIMNFYWDGDVVGTLPVFDGINLPLDKLGEYSEKANKAIFDAWMGNAMKALSESYSVFMQDTDGEIIRIAVDKPILFKKLASAFYGPSLKVDQMDGEKLSWLRTDLSLELVKVNEKLKNAAIEVEIRHLAMQDISAGIDQMAGFSSPYQHQGTISVEGMSDEKIIEVLNERREFHRERVTKQLSKTQDISEAISNSGYHDMATGAKVFYQENLSFLGSQMNIPQEQRWMYNELVNSKALEGWTFITGTNEQIRAKAEQLGVAAEHLNNLEKGLTLTGQKIIIFPNATGETLVHEMVHAATFSIIHAHYSGTLPGKGNADIAGAVGGLEILMRQFMELSEELPALSTETMQQYLHARSVIQIHLNQGKNPLAQASALNEFMAYTQSNPALIRMTKNTTANPLVRISKMVLEFIKELVWGKRAPKVGGDMFTNIRFNTALLARYQPSIAATMAAASTAVLPHSSPKNDLRLRGIRDNFLKRIPNHLKMPLTKDGVLTGKVTTTAIQVATEAAMTLNAHGFPMEPIEQSTFTSIVQTLATQAVIDPNTMARAQELFTLATKTLTVADFIDPSNTDAGSALYYANEQYNAVMGNYYEGKDALGRSTLLPVFMGLAITNEKFRGVLSKLELPKTKLKDWDSLDSAFENAGNSLMEKLSLRLSGEGKHAPNVQAAIDALTEHLMSTANNDLLTRMTEGFADWRETRLNKRNNRLLGYIDKSAKALHKASVSALKNPQYGKFSQTLGKLGELTSAIINEDNAEIVAQGIVSTINKVDGFRTLREVIADIVGRTDSNAEIYDQNKLVRTMVSQDRQHYRDDLPGVILEQFSRTVTKEEMTAMFHGLGKTDIALLRESMKDAEIRELFTKPSALPMAIRTVETQLKTADPQHWNQVEKKARQLADYMNGKGYGNNLLRNAESVANLFDEPQQAKRTKPDEAYIKAVDKLVSLYAIDGLSNENLSSLSSLVQSEAQGVDFVMAYLTGQRAEEMRKANASLTARMNYFKGFVPSSQDGNVTMVVASDAEYSKLIGKSYTKVESYKGSSLVGGEPRSYYFANVPGRAAYNQGTMQNARQTAGGIDLATGFTDGLMTAGRITDRKLVYRLAQNLRNERATTEPLLPVRSADGVIVAFERAVDPKQLERLSQSTDLAKMIGVWRGRQVEEAKVQVFNEALVDAAKKMYKTDLQNSSSKKAEYINVFDPKEQKKDPVLADAVRLLNPETIKYIEDVFGKGTFMVRKELANDMLGYRGATIGDFWTGNHRWSPETEAAVKNLAISVFGNKAYQYMVNGERILQNVVGSAKTLIVMKSIIVPISNLIGNVYQLISRGVPLLSIAKGMPRKTLEVDSYSKSRRREVKVEALLRAAEGDVINTRKLSAELQSIRDSYRRMSIWPLIEAGQFSSISDMEVASEDVQLTSGKLHEYIESLVDKLPTSIRNAGRYALVTKDTALFQGLQKAVNYGDFIAKAVLYDDLTQRKGLTSKEALARITEEFVNYDRLPGRSRGYLESVGMLWFYNFKLRLVKIALSTIRNNPVHALVVGMMPKPDLFGSIGTPITDNLFSKAWSGGLGNSIGPGMLFNAPMLLPTVNAVFD